MSAANMSAAKVRAVLAVVCALALLVAGFIHTTHHHPAPSGALAWQAATTADAAGDLPDGERATGEHCCACNMMAMPTVGMMIAPAASHAPPAFGPPARLSTHLTPADPPPPRA
jgi:hypothetical protein